MNWDDVLYADSYTITFGWSGILFDFQMPGSTTVVLLVWFLYDFYACGVVTWLICKNLYISLFWVEISACALLRMLYVMGGCNLVRSIILLPFMMGWHLCLSH